MSSLLQVPTKIVYKRKNGHKEVFLRYEELGHGGLATVFRVKHQNSNKIYAMKIISKQFLKTKGEFALKKLKDEIKIQKKLNHPNILRSKLTFSDKLNYYIVLEYCPGQSIREFLKKSENGYLNENYVRKILRDVIHGLVYLHSHKIVHNDLKLENFIIDSKGRVKISDFGLATFYEDDKDDDDDTPSICGTINYLSPEIIQRKGNGFKADIWAIGVSAFIMLTGRPPFEGINREAVFGKILDCEYHFPSQIPISPDAKKLIQSILQIKPFKRPTASDLLNFPFLAKIDREQVELYRPIEKVEFSEINQIGTYSQIYTPNQPNANSMINKENVDQNERVQKIIEKIHSRANRIREMRRRKYLKEHEDDSQNSDDSDDFHVRSHHHLHKIHRKSHVSHKRKYSDSDIDDELELSD